MARMSKWLKKNFLTIFCPQNKKINVILIRERKHIIIYICKLKFITNVWKKNLNLIELQEVSAMKF
jgi:hypothetical protein